MGRHRITLTDAEHHTVHRLIRRAAERHHVSPLEILSRRRSKEIVRARYAAILSVRAAFPHWGRNPIARVFLLDPSTILHAYRRAPEMGLGSG